MAEPAPTDAVSDTVVVYGIRERRRAVRLLHRLAEIPCYPSTIYRIDQQSRYFGALDQIRSPARIYYIHVLNWCDRNQGLPVICWSPHPRALANFLAKEGPAALVRYTSRVRAARPMTLEMNRREHAELYAKMKLSAS